MKSRLARSFPRNLPKISPKAWLIGIRLKKTTLNKAVYQLAQEHNLLDAVTLLSFFSGLQSKYVHNLMVRFDSTGIATVCRATGIGAKEFQAICKERCKHLKFPESTGSKWLTNYHMLDETDARRFALADENQAQDFSRGKGGLTGGRYSANFGRLPVPISLAQLPAFDVQEFTVKN